jgi:hypothetical protein
MFVFEACPAGPLGPVCNLVGGFFAGIIVLGLLRMAMAVLRHYSRSKPDAPHVRLFKEIEKVTRDNTLYLSRVPSAATWSKRLPQISNDSEAIAQAADLLEALGDRFASVKPQPQKSDIAHDVGCVTSTILGSIGYVRIYEFSERVPSQVEQVLTAMTNVTGLVLDLRTNHGGSLMSAVRTSALFLKYGTVLNIVRQEENQGNSTFSGVRSISLITQFVVKNVPTPTRMYACPSSNDLWNKIEKRLPYWLNGRPLVILVNEETASAAEVLVGALKDSNETVKLVGRNTYGKGVIQVQFPILDKATLWLTTHRFTTPSGYWPGDGASKRQGLKPHVVIMEPAERSSERSADGRSVSLPDIVNDADVQLCLQLVERMLIKKALSIAA